MRKPLQIRPAVRQDCTLIAELVRELAEYEREPESARLTAADFERDGFDAQPAFECLVAEVDDVGCGIALFFPYYSTWEGRGIYLEDLYVRPEYRGLGVGKLLLAEVARLTVARGAVRLDWSVLAWNEPALRFYATLGAERMEEWRKMRLSGAALAGLADPTSQVRALGHPDSSQDGRDQKQILRFAQNDPVSRDGPVLFAAEDKCKR